MKRPTFFLSSTIYDFRDLRGAIKFTLEARGCRVLASEFNDFAENLDKHSYEACLTNIEQADYYILLVGSRVGGWYDEPNRVSITQQEYRTAYARHKLGLLKIVTLARAEVWQLREDRAALARHLADKNLTEAEQKGIVDFPSRFATDANFIVSFLSEIGRNEETDSAVKTGSPKPTGNWIHLFQDFRDVDDVLYPLTFSGLTADEAAFSKALQHELLFVLSRLLDKQGGSPMDRRKRLREHLAEFPIDQDARFRETFDIDNEKWQKFSTIVMSLLGTRLDVVVIEDALTSTRFLIYNRETGAYVQSPAYEALFRLVEEIRMFNFGNTNDTLSLIFEYSPRSIGLITGAISLPTQRLAMLYGLVHRWINIISLSIALIVHLEGKPFVSPELMPFSPIKGFDDEIAKETASPAEIRVALGI
jgi:Domain of unknown function (DUF4062)